MRVPDPANPAGWTTVNIIDSQVQYDYDALGRLATVTTDRRNQFPADFDPENPTLDETVTYSYNAVGSLKSVEYPNGNYAYYRYDGLNRLRELTNFAQVEADPDAPVGAILSRFAYSLYADGQRSQAIETLGGSSRTVAWQYDGLNRLVRETVDGTQTDEYVYDLAGNRLSKTSDGAPTYYFYDVHDRLDRECSDADGLNILVQYGYDLNGSQTGKAVTGGEATVYTYSLPNRLAAAATGSNPTVSYRYNPDGIRIQKAIAGGAVTHYTVDPFNPTGYAQVLTSDDGTNRTYYVLGSDIAGQAVNGLAPTCYLYDGHGSVRQDADASGSVLQPYHYDAYGNAEGFTPVDGLYYTGEMYDADLGQYYLRARCYNPSNGLFNRVDPYSGNLQDPQSLHKYLYCHANSVNNLDPLGLFSWENAWQGTAIHQRIGQIYIEKHATHDVDTNYYPIRGISLNKYPDIIDYTLKEIMEIKPLNPGAMAEGYKNLIEELTAANESNVPGAINCHNSDKPWTPGFWLPEERIISVPGYPNSSVYVVGNFGGLIAYKRFEMPEQKLRQKLTIEDQIEIQKEFQKITQGMNIKRENYLFMQVPLILALTTPQQGGLIVSHAVCKAAQAPTMNSLSMKSNMSSRTTLTTFSRGF